MRLWHRLFLAFAAVSVLAMLAFAGWQQRAFHRGFLAYLDQVQLERMREVADRIGDAYAAAGNWQFLRGDPHALSRLIDGHEARGRVPGPDGVAPRAGPPGRPQGPPVPRGPPPFAALHDMSGALVAGFPQAEDAHALPVIVGGESVGVLRIQRLPRISGEQDVEFARDQAHAALAAMLAVLVGALAAAFLLARWLLAPVRALAGATHALAAGDYARRVDATRADEIGKLADDFNRLAASLEQHREARRQWGADIAHELRTPLSILRGEIQALQDGIRPLDGAALASLDAECARLASLIDDLYELSLADAGALDYRFEPVDLGAIVAEAVELQRHACDEAGLSLDIAIAAVPRVQGDARRLAQLVDNLLVNARRYTDAPGRIDVGVRMIDGRAGLVVQDSAPAVAAEHLPRLFDRLYRIERSRARSHGGVGLGLAICSAIVRAHGGTIAAGDSPLGGLCVEVRLPVSRKAAS